VQGPHPPALFSAPLSFPDPHTGYTLVDPQHGSGVEAEGSLYRTTDGGATWSPVGRTPVDGRLICPTRLERGSTGPLRSTPGLDWVQNLAADP
jgi:hypothetical protein